MDPGDPARVPEWDRRSVPFERLCVPREEKALEVDGARCRGVLPRGARGYRGASDALPDRRELSPGLGASPQW